jgi:hypothetical protein
MCLNVFIDNVIGILPSHSHCNVFAMHTHLHFFFHSIQWLPSQHAIPLHSFFSILVDSFQLSYNLSLLFTSIHHPTFHIPHSMSSLVVLSIAEPNFNFNFFLLCILFVFFFLFFFLPYILLVIFFIKLEI